MAKASFAGLTRRLAALRCDSRGASLLEFGLFFPILALFLLGTIDLGRGLAAKFHLEQAAQRTIELANLGNRPQADYSFLIAEAAAAAEVPATQVTLEQWLECRSGTGTLRRAAQRTGPRAAFEPLLERHLGRRHLGRRCSLGDQEAVIRLRSIAEIGELDRPLRRLFEMELGGEAAAEVDCAEEEQGEDREEEPEFEKARSARVATQRGEPARQSCERCLGHASGPRPSR